MNQNNFFAWGFAMALLPYSILNAMLAGTSPRVVSNEAKSSFNDGRAASDGFARFVDEMESFPDFEGASLGLLPPGTECSLPGVMEAVSYKAVPLGVQIGSAALSSETPLIGLLPGRGLQIVVDGMAGEKLVIRWRNDGDEKYMQWRLASKDAVDTLRRVLLCVTSEGCSFAIDLPAFQTLPEPAQRSLLCLSRGKIRRRDYSTDSLIDSMGTMQIPAVDLPAPSEFAP